MFARFNRSSCCTLLLSCATLLVAADSAQADWYSGDPYTQQTGWPQYTDNLSNASQTYALTFDNFTWVPGAGGGVIDVVGGHFHSFGQLSGLSIDNAQWEIRTGMSHNNGGTLVASGSGAVIPYATSFTQGGVEVWGVDVDVPDFALPAGNYWFGLAIGVNDGQPGWFVASTSGASGIGGPLGDDLSVYFQSNNSIVSWDYVESAIINPTLSGFDPSYYIREVPEPSTFALAALALALAAVGKFRRR